VKKILAATALAVLSVLFLTGCGAPAAAPAPSVTAAPLAAPDPAQRASLMTEFKKIDPVLGTPKSVEDARYACRLILHGAPDGAQLATARRILKDAKVAPGAASDGAAKKIIDVIKANGFCKAAA
jgi:hypothetical protein